MTFQLAMSIEDVVADGEAALIIAIYKTSRGNWAGLRRRPNSAGQRVALTCVLERSRRRNMCSYSA